MALQDKASHTRIGLESSMLHDPLSTWPTATEKASDITL
ncbi:hypothetical protein EYZ11_013558 [Aspergillus tanneri]|uniref:Uncharacterized protein n=1 Tax=Aspergillus tanneri TaxID=1220188 RepID=A0A4S3IXM1_9EURO|nr:hypothetical protein EYZ11_013558 [Aspergillus tanneri]